MPLPKTNVVQIVNSKNKPHWIFRASHDWCWSAIELQKLNTWSRFHTLYLKKTNTFCFWSPCRTSHSFKKAVALPYSSISLRKRLQLYIEPYCQTQTNQRSKPWSWTWHFWFKFSTPQAQVMVICPGGDVGALNWSVHNFNFNFLTLN